MAADEGLMAMVRRWSELPAGERAIVLSALSDHEAEELRRLAAASSAVGLSPGLRALMEACADGRRVEGVTPRASAALRAAAAVAAEPPAIETASERPVSLWQRIVGV